MDRQPDKLFREKLRGFQKPVPGSAWKRISENLHAEDRKYPWFRLAIAAAVLLILLTAVLLFVPRQEKAPTTLANRGTVPKTERAPSGIGNSEDRREAQETDREDKSDAVISHQKTTQAAKSRNGYARPHRPDVQKVEQGEATERVSIRDSAFFARKAPLQDLNQLQTHDTSGDGIAVSAPPAAKPSPQRIKIVFSAEEVNEKYLDKKELAEATTESKNSSSIRKLLDKAYDLKYNQDPLGQLRQKKNEILALNFKNEKVQHD